MFQATIGQGGPTTRVVRLLSLSLPSGFRQLRLRFNHAAVPDDAAQWELLMKAVNARFGHFGMSDIQRSQRRAFAQGEKSAIADDGFACDQCAKPWAAGDFYESRVRDR